SQNPDWTHINSVAYHPQLDQIMLSVRNFSEIWIIDHSTTTAEAASNTGGNSGRGGDLLYRWGNPQNYNRGTAADRKLFAQHAAHWIPEGYPGAGKMLLFNNGEGRPDGNYSSVETITLPQPINYNYPIAPGMPYDPPSQDWIYTANPPAAMYSPVVSGAQRLLNGNTLICVGQSGTFLEIDSNENLVWKYINPVTLSGPVAQGSSPSGNIVFRCILYPPDYPAFVDKTLVAGAPIEKNPLPYDCETGLTEPTTTFTENLKAYPNPCTKSFIFIPAYDFSGSVELRDPLGRLLHKATHPQWRGGVPYSFSTGQYRGWLLLQLRNTQGQLLGFDKLLVN
ncbi:MAG: aryl-sulfate sulfotransferase, partial [Chitinophagales bacterium]|nr:aryl-sulfate sulfotransferase [Chitinophagales bacterium]MDW8428665.1 aryl-sulfate sulfotransferase [Chitinophagales bacterium]